MPTSLIRRWGPALAAVLVIVVTVMLGNWQTRRAEGKLLLEASRQRALTMTPNVMPTAPVPAETLDWQRMRASGTFDAARTVFIDNRSHQGVAGLHVLTPLKLQGSELHLLVLRGWVASDPRDRNRLPAVPTPTGTVHVEGITLAQVGRSLELGGHHEPAAGDRLWSNVDVPGFARWSGLRMQSAILRQETALPGFVDGLVRDWPVPGSDVPKHRGYAFQWYSLAALTAGLWIYFGWWRKRKGVRRGADVD